MVIGEIVTSNARRYPEETAFIFEDIRLTWRQVNERVNALANALLAMGLEKRDRVAILAPNSHRLVETYFALAKAGLVAVPINNMLVSDEIAHVVDDAGARCLLVADEFVDRIECVQKQLAGNGVDTFIGMGEKHGYRYDYETLVKEYPATEPEVAVHEDDWRAVKYTSGTTGMPKGYLVTHRQMQMAIMNFLVQIPHSRRDKCLMTLPITVGAGTHLTYSYCYLGCTIVILKRFDPVAVFQAIEKERLDTIHVVPTILISLMNHPDVKAYDLSSLRLIGYGGSPMAVPVLKQLLATFKCDFYQVFGSSEGGGYTSFLMPEDHRLNGANEDDSQRQERRLASCGREALGAHQRVVDDDGRDVTVGQMGEMIFRTESVVSGLWVRGGGCTSILKDGWVHMGDMATMDEDGYVYIVDRKKDVIISGGLNVYPAEVEAVLYRNPAIKEVAVIGVPDEKWGEAVKALVVLKEGMACGEEDILGFCRENLAAYKRPKTVELLESLPKSSLGKILKRELREKYWQGYERRVH